jgi:hypothetical protein
MSRDALNDAFSDATTRIPQCIEELREMLTTVNPSGTPFAVLQARWRLRAWWQTEVGISAAAEFKSTRRLTQLVPPETSSPSSDPCSRQQRGASKYALVVV